jgi:Uma2 family endonuclease
MTAQTLTYPPITLEDFLRFEYHAASKHEFEDGKIFAMAGGSAKHNLIILNIAFALRQASQKAGCQVLTQDMKVVSDLEPPFSYYPDVLVVCDPEDNAEYFRTRPCFIAEVLSDSTAKFDQGEKKRNYQRLEGLKSYLIVHQKKKLAELHRKLEDGTWQLEQYEAGDGIALPCPETTLTLEQIYEGVE